MILLQVPLLDVVTHHTLKGIGQKSTGRGVITHREFIKSVFSEIACRTRVITIVFSTSSGRISGKCWLTRSNKSDILMLEPVTDSGFAVSLGDFVVAGSFLRSQHK